MNHPIEATFRALVTAVVAELGYITRAEVEALVSQRLKELQSTSFRKGNVEWQGSNSGSWMPSITSISFGAEVISEIPSTRKSTPEDREHISLSPRNFEEIESYAAMEANVAERVAEMQAEEASPVLLSSPGREKFREIARNDVATLQNNLSSIILEKRYNTGARSVALEVASEDEFGLRFYSVIEAALADADNCIRQDATQALDRVRQHSIAYKAPNGSRLWAETGFIFARLRLDRCEAVSLSARDGLDLLWTEERELNDIEVQQVAVTTAPEKRDGFVKRHNIPAPPIVEVTSAQPMDMPYDVLSKIQHQVMTEAPSAPTANRLLSRAEVAKSRHLRKLTKVTQPATPIAESLHPVDVDIDLDESL